jgi:hypothetical protein
MLIVIDDFLNQDQLEKMAAQYRATTNPNTMTWFGGSFVELTEKDSYTALVLKEASKYFDLSSMVGCERWAHFNTRTDWHYDKDEKNKELVHPLCSTVFYPIVEDLVGGEFVTQDCVIKPKQNRLIVFSSTILHKVEPFTGTRLAVAVAPWHYKLAEYA